MDTSELKGCGDSDTGLQRLVALRIRSNLEWIDLDCVVHYVLWYAVLCACRDTVCIEHYPFMVGLTDETKITYLVFFAANM